MQFKMELGKTFSLPGAPANAFKRRSIRAATEKYISQMVWRHYSLFWLCHSNMVALFQQYAENRDFFSNFSADGLHNWSILLVIPLEFQERKHQPFLMTQPLFFEIPNKTKSLLWNVIVSSPQYGEKTAFFLQFFRWRTLRLRYFIGYPFGASRNAALSISLWCSPKNGAP